MFNLDLLRIPSSAAAAAVALAVSIRFGTVMHLSALRAGLPLRDPSAVPLPLAPV